MDIDTLPDHIRKPHLRPIQPIGVQKEGKQLVALRDPCMLSRQTMMIQPAAMRALQMFQGNRNIEDIAKSCNTRPDQIVALAQACDKVGLLWGPTFDELEGEAVARLEAEKVFPIGAAGALGEDPDTARSRIEQWLDETEDPELGTAVKGIVAPHLDYERGWPNYAAAYRCLDQNQRPDRVVILGTNHFGIGDGVVLTRFGFESPFGRCEADSDVVDRLVDTLGKEIIIDELDHLGEHSIQLHLPWLQHRYGDVPIVAALVPDPLKPMIEDDGKRIEMVPFAEALGEVLGEIGGESLIVGSSDLSHVGPQFGEPRPVDEQRRLDVERHDREMMGKFCTGDADEFLSALKWCNNPTGWCSIGNMTAILMLTQPEAVELIDYRQAFDDKGMVMVTSAAFALV